MSALTFDLTKSKTLEIAQEEHDDTVIVSTKYSCGGVEGSFIIPKEELINLLNMYAYVKNFDIQSYFLNPQGKNVDDKYRL